MTTDSYRRYARRGPEHFGRLQVLYGLARGCWKGIYAWYLYEILGLTAGRVAVILGAQFIVQILCEIPSGLYADKGRRGALLRGASIAFVLYSALYFAAGIWVPTDLANGSTIAFEIALFAEVVFGIATAIFSGSLDAWIADLESSLAGPDRESFHRRLKVLSGIKFVTGTLSRAVLGVTVYWLTFYKFRGWHWAGWIGAACLYTAAAIYAHVYIRKTEDEFRLILDADRRKRPESPPWWKDVRAWWRNLLSESGRVSFRALSYLSETPSVIRVFLQTAMIHVVFYASQAYWLVYFKDCLGGRRDTPSAIRQVPIFLLIWGAGEFAEAAGSASTRRIERLAKRLGSDPYLAQSRSLVLYLVLYAVSIGGQIAALRFPPDRAISVFGLAFVIGRALEGGIRRQLDEFTNLVMVSERGTLQSVDSLTKSIFGLVVVTSVGYLTASSPVNGLAVMGLIVLSAAVIALAYPINTRSVGLPPEKRLRRTVDESTKPRRGFRGVVPIVVSLVVIVLGGVVGAEQLDRFELWRRVSGRDYVTVRLHELRPAPTRERWLEASQVWQLSMPSGRVMAGESVSCGVDIAPRDLRNSDTPPSGFRKVTVDGTRVHFDVVLEMAMSGATDAGSHPAAELSADVRVGSTSQLHWNCSLRDARGSRRPLLVFVDVESALAGAGADSPAVLALEVGVAFMILLVIFSLGQLYAAGVRRNATQTLRGAAGTFREFAHRSVSDLHPSAALARLAEGAKLKKEGKEVYEDLEAEGITIGALELRAGEPGADAAWHHSIRAPQNGPADAAWIDGLFERLSRLESHHHGEECAATYSLEELDAWRPREAGAATIQKWTREQPKAVATMSAPIEARDWFVSWVAVVDEDTAHRRCVAFAITIERQRGVRYTDPLHRALLSQLADIALLQHRATKLRIRNFDHWHDINRGLGRVKLVADAFASAIEQSKPVSLKAFRSVVDVEAGHIDGLLRPREDEDGQVNLRDEVLQVAEGLSDASFLDAADLGVAVSSMTVDWDVPQSVNVSRSAARDLRLVLREILRNAQKHGKVVDMRFGVSVKARADRDTVRLVARTPMNAPEIRPRSRGEDRPSSVRELGGFGLVGMKHKIESHGGKWIRSEAEGPDFVVEFAIPVAMGEKEEA